MSALRISRPGQPTTFVLQEPAKARIPGYNGSSIGFFSGTTLLPRLKSNNERRREQLREASQRYRDRTK